MNVHIGGDRPLLLTDRMRELLTAQATALGALLDDPSPLNRAAYLNAARRTTREQFPGQPKAIRLMDEVAQETADWACAQWGRRAGDEPSDDEQPDDDEAAA